MIGELTKDVADYFKLDSTKGVMVNEVLEGSPAQKAGLQVGDIILKMDDRDVEGVGPLRNRIAAVTPGTKVKLLIYRNGKEQTVTVSVGELSDTSSRAEAPELSKKLGLTVQNLTEDMSRYYGLRSNEGVVVSSVASDGLAFRAGIRPGTIILSVNLTKVHSVDEFHKALQASVESNKVLLLIREQGYARFVAIPLD
jgi:serine protease Do